MNIYDDYVTISITTVKTILLNSSFSCGSLPASTFVLARNWLLVIGRKVGRPFVFEKTFPLYATSTPGATCERARA